MNSDLISNFLESDLMFYFKISFFLSHILCICYLAKIWHSYSFFKKMGIPAPKYDFFYGNFTELKREKYSETLQKWSKIYGTTYGYYEGHYPIMVTSDTELIREIFITKSSNFAARKFVPAQYKDNDFDTNVGSSSKLRWKRLRNILQPTFSPQKLKEILPLMRTCADRFIHKVEENLDKEFFPAESVKAFTMDTLSNCKRFI